MSGKNEKRLLSLVEIVEKTQACLFHFSELIIELCSLSTSNLFTHFLQKRNNEREKNKSALESLMAQ